MKAVRGALFDRYRFSRFASIGIIGAVLDVTLSSALVVGPGVGPEFAKFVGAECAIVLMFLLNDRWTFPNTTTSGWRHGLRRLIKSNIVRSGGIAVQLVVVYALTRSGLTIDVAGTDIWPVVTMPIAIACGFFLNYVGETLVTWRVAS